MEKIIKRTKWVVACPTHLKKREKSEAGHSRE
jgi:hypothetical protein